MEKQTFDKIKKELIILVVLFVVFLSQKLVKLLKPDKYALFRLISMRIEGKALERLNKFYGTIVRTSLFL